MKTNIEILKNDLCKYIDSMTPEELYEFLLDPKPIVSSLCKYCRAEYGDCLDTIENDTLCVGRFKKWSEEEAKNNKA